MHKKSSWLGTTVMTWPTAFIWEKQEGENLGKETLSERKNIFKEQNRNVSWAHNDRPLRQRLTAMQGSEAVLSKIILSESCQTDTFLHCFSVTLSLTVWPRSGWQHHTPYKAQSLFWLLSRALQNLLCLSSTWLGVETWLWGAEIPPFTKPLFLHLKNSVKILWKHGN